MLCFPHRHERRVPADAHHRERLASAEPGRAAYQRDLSVSYERMGDVYRALRRGEPARAASQQPLTIRERLAAAEPDRELTMKQIHRGTFRSVPQLKAAIQAFIEAHQANPKPFVWRKAPMRSWPASPDSLSGP
jgi:hypothetical protein